VTRVQLAETRPGDLGGTETKFLLMVHPDAHTASRCHGTCYKSTGRDTEGFGGEGEFSRARCSFISSTMLDEFNKFIAILNY